MIPTFFPGQHMSNLPVTPPATIDTDAAKAAAAQAGTNAQIKVATIDTDAAQASAALAAANAQAAASKAAMVRSAGGPPAGGGYQSRSDEEKDQLVNQILKIIANSTATASSKCEESNTDSSGVSIILLALFFCTLVFLLGSCGLPLFLKRIIMHRFSVFALICFFMLLVCLILRISGQSTYISALRDYLADPGYDCPCDRVCAHPDWEPAVSSDTCQGTDNDFPEGFICLRKAGRMGCFSESDCTGGDMLGSCTKDQYDVLSTYWYGMGFLDTLVFYHVCSDVMFSICILVSFLYVFLSGNAHMLRAYRVIVPVSFLVFMCLAVWECLLEDLVNANTGEMWTAIPKPCPESDTASQAQTGQSLNVIGTVMGSVTLVLLALDAAFILDKRRSTENICEYVKIYAVLVGVIGAIGFAGSYLAIGGWVDDIDTKIKGTSAGYWAYSGLWALLYSLPLIGLALSYVFELLSRSGTISKADALGNGCYMIQSVNVVTIVASLVVEIVIVALWCVAWGMDTVCFHVMTQGREIFGFDEQTCEMARNVYNGTFYGMCMLGPLGILAGGFCFARVWGTWAVAVCEQEEAEEDDSIDFPEHLTLMKNGSYADY